MLIGVSDIYMRDKDRQNQVMLYFTNSLGPNIGSERDSKSTSGSRGVQLPQMILHGVYTDVDKPLSRLPVPRDLEMCDAVDGIKWIDSKREL
jgi:hypothetical protein